MQKVGFGGDCGGVVELGEVVDGGSAVSVGGMDVGAVGEEGGHGGGDEMLMVSEFVGVGAGEEEGAACGVSRSSVGRARNGSRMPSDWWMSCKMESLSLRVMNGFAPFFNSNSIIRIISGRDVVLLNLFRDTRWMG
jgi:hypothetical protein